MFFRGCPKNGQDNHSNAKVAFDDVGATSRGGMDPVEVVENVGKLFRCETTSIDNLLQIVVLLAHPHAPLHGNG
jgi:hypothetical protein